MEKVSPLVLTVLGKVVEAVPAMVGPGDTVATEGVPLMTVTVMGFCGVCER